MRGGTRGALTLARAVPAAPVLAVLFGVAAAGCGASSDEPVIRLYAAASLAPVLEELVPGFEAAHGLRVEMNTASSSVLARQIAAGAPADYFVSADRKSVEWLVAEGYAGAPAALWGNTLVVAAPAGSALRFDSGAPERFAAELNGRLAVGDPEYVPLGRYARDALEHAGLWGALADRMVPAADARAALVLVARGDCAAGVVYESDAESTDRVVVIGRIPPDWHGPVRYYGTVPDGSRVEAGCTLGRWLESPEVADRVRQYGLRP